ncbi:hypothetical protein Mapa_001091 [Marchantia paleacea]|nr:hypothetical protein Mapa_001091 [Marchantia paleacea]
MASCSLQSAVACTANLSRVQGPCSTSVNSLPGWSRSNWRSDTLVWDVLRLSSYQENRVLGFSTRAQNDPQYVVSDANTQETESQIIVPNVNTADYLYGEKEMSKSVDVEDTSEAEEDGDDPWLLEFQNEVQRIKETWSDVERITESWNQVSDYSGLPRNTSRRRVLGAPMFMSLALVFGWAGPQKQAHAMVPAKIDLTTTPKTALFDAGDERLQNAASVFRQALEATTVEEEERLWTEVINTSENVDAEWVQDILARAFGNRGNARSRQGNLEEALVDYNRSIQLAPYAVDPVLNRGVALESLGRYEEASADYEAVLKAQPEDPAAWNNLGNVKAAMSKWDDALRSYLRAVQLAPKFSFAAANYALALYQVGRDNEAVRQFRNLLRKYPEFADVRAALAVSLYQQGLYGEAETNWGRLEDGRYRDRDWVKNTRRWPPRLTSALEDFLDVKQKTIT